MGSSLWSQHLAQLLRITPTRHSLYGTEPYPFIIWQVCLIDINALLSGSGSGEFVEAMLRSNLIPAASEHPLAIGLTEASGVQYGDTELVLSILGVNRAVSILAARLGHLARDIRELLVRRRADDQSQVAASRIEIRNGQQQVLELQERLRRTWNNQLPAQLTSRYENQNVPERARGVFEHVWLPLSFLRVPLSA